MTLIVGGPRRIWFIAITAVTFKAGAIERQCLVLTSVRCLGRGYALLLLEEHGV